MIQILDDQVFLLVSNFHFHRKSQPDLPLIIALTYHNIALSLIYMALLPGY